MLGSDAQEEPVSWLLAPQACQCSAGLDTPLRHLVSLSAARQRSCGNFPKVFPVHHLTANPGLGSPVVWFPLYQQAGQICSRSTAKLEADVMTCHASVLLNAWLLMPRCHPSSTAPVPSGPRLPLLPPPCCESFKPALRLASLQSLSFKASCSRSPPTKRI